MTIKWNLYGAFGGMNKGDSIFVPCIACTPLQNNMFRVAYAYGYKIRIMTTTQHQIKGLRVWRIN